MNISTKTFWAALVLTCTATFASDASAVEVRRYDMQSAVGACRAAYGEDESKLLVRPLGIVNQHTASVPVNCALQGDANAAGRRTWQFVVNVANDNIEVIQVDCTLVDGERLGGTQQAQYDTQTAFVLGLSTTPIAFRAADPVPIRRPSLFCMLPPKGVLSYIGLYYYENIGN